MSETTTRTLGPVTMATGGAVALTTLVCFIITRAFDVELPNEVQGAITLVLVMVSGIAVPGRRKQGRYEA